MTTAAERKAAAAERQAKQDEAEGIIDLDASRAARREHRGPTPKVRLGGEIYELPEELPAEAVHAMGALMHGDLGQLETGMKAIFGDVWDDLKAGLSLDDETFLLEQALEKYGIDLPKSEGSESSS